MTGEVAPLAVGDRVVVELDGFAAMLAALVRAGHELLGPTVAEGAIVLDSIAGVDGLPRGVGDEQAPGRYRLRARGDDALFGYAASPHAWKRFVLPPRVPLVQIRRRAGALEVEAAAPPVAKRAFIGVRGCELAAIAILDRVLAGGPHADADYQARRAGVFVIAVHCGAPAGTCFCTSQGTGPRAGVGFDLGVTELCGESHRFVVEIASDAGAAIAAAAHGRAATSADLAAERAVHDAAVAQIRTQLDPTGLRDALLANLEHPRWDAIAQRCLGCASCTAVCPTCFCTTIEDTTDLSGDVATRTRRWDSCFTPDFAYVHGGSVRPSLRARYRQWLSHKLATWHDQFGTSGCVGCGRCITWCPVGIDLTAEAAAITAGRPRSHEDG